MMESGCYKISVAKNPFLGKCVYNKTFLFRLLGLMFWRELKVDYGVLLAPCSSIHMFFMRFAIDAIFIDCEGRVLKIYHGIKPWRITLPIMGAWGVIEVPVGTARESNLKKGTILSFEKIKDL